LVQGAKSEYGIGYENAMKEISVYAEEQKQGHNDAVRVGVEYQRQLTIATGDLKAMTVEANMLLTENRKLEQQLAAVTQERDEQCAGMTRLTAAEKVEVVRAFLQGEAMGELAVHWEVATGQVETWVRQAMQRKAWWRDRA
jgi:DNA-directed RNA polymerase specialized sigma24 family protein